MEQDHWMFEALASEVRKDLWILTFDSTAAGGESGWEENPVDRGENIGTSCKVCCV